VHGTLFLAAISTLAAAGTPAAAPAGAAATCAAAEAIPTAAHAEAARSAVLCLLDAARAARDVEALRREPHLRRAAQGFARTLAASGALPHDGGGASVLRRVRRAGYDPGAGFTAAEVLGRSSGGAAAPAQRVARWLRDPSSRRLLLSGRFRDVGVGVAVASDGTATYVVDVGAAVSRPAPPRRATP
jgi:uncharacterized protein YkwD